MQKNRKTHLITGPAVYPGKQSRGGAMELLRFEERLKLHNWNYQKASNAVAWQTGHHEYKKLIEISFKSPEHRRLFIRYKIMKGVIT